MKTIELAEAIYPLAEYVEKLGNEPIILTNDGKPVAALISLENMDLETISLSTDPQFLKIIENSRARYKSEGGISAEEMSRRLSQ
jgi:PHD/YefM family antitoxin component YafN of YafNO toxin-antitoxin module